MMENEDSVLLELIARAITEADGVEPERPCHGIGRYVPKGETWPAWKVRTPQAEAVLKLVKDGKLK